MSSPDEGDTDRAFYLPRLDRRFYQGHAHVHWTLTMRDRVMGWLSAELHLRFRELLLHTMARGSLICPVYCLMPDHLHMIWMGLDESCDQMKSIAFFDTYFEPMLSPVKLQPQPHDHVLREEENTQDAFQNAAHYILENPLRAKLVRERTDWPYLGCMVPGYPKLHPVEEGYWEKFWRIHAKLKRRVGP
jgi:putative transposase